MEDQHAIDIHLAEERERERKESILKEIYERCDKLKLKRGDLQHSVLNISKYIEQERDRLDTLEECLLKLVKGS